MFQSGDTHSAVNIIKSFLNTSSRTAITNLKSDNKFDDETKKSLAEFQRNKGLNATGEMNLKTWLAIGAEMDPITIDLISMPDHTVRDLLQMGYRSKFPFKKINSNNPSGIDGSVQTESAGFPVLPPDSNFSFRLFVAIFAPFDLFGPLNLSKGDTKNRRFGFDPFETYRLRATSTVYASPGKHTYEWSVTKASDATTSYLLVPSSIPTGVLGVSLPSAKWKTAKSEGTVSDEDTGVSKPDGLYQDGNALRFHFYGNDDAFALIGDDSLITSDIDVHANIKFHYDWQPNPKSVLMKVSGTIIGDQFPAVETYILDRSNNGLMLGVWQVREGDGPVFTRNGGLEDNRRQTLADD